MRRERKTYRTCAPGRHGRQEPAAGGRRPGWNAMVLAALLLFSLFASAALAATGEVKLAVGKKGFTVDG